MTAEQFNESIQVCLGLRFVPGTLVGHYESVKDVPENVFREACLRAAKTRNEFPTPYELRLDCDAVKSRTVTAVKENRTTELAKPVVFSLVPPGSDQPITLTVKREWKYHCEHCRDSGWREWQCGRGGDDRNDCTRRGDHDPHGYAVECSCKPTNPDIQRRIQAQSRYAEVRAEKSGRYRGGDQ